MFSSLFVSLETLRKYCIAKMYIVERNGLMVFDCVSVQKSFADAHNLRYSQHAGDWPQQPTSDLK